MFRRSDSFTSICSCSTDPPEISLEDEDINLESYQQVDSYQELGDYSIPINPELDFVQPTHRIVNFSLNQPKYKSLLEYWRIRNDINSHDPSESGSNFRNPIQKESENNSQLLKEFVPDMDMLGKEFNSEKNRVKREAYRANHTKEQKVEILEKWKIFMKEVKTDYPFFDYLEKHFQSKKKNKPLPKDMPSKKLRCPIQKAEKLVSPSLETNVSIALKPDQESPSNLISHKDSSSLKAPSSSDKTLLSTDSCCRDKTIKVLPKQEKLFPDLIKEPKRKSQSDFQITGPTVRISILKCLKWKEITFPADWTLENENHTLQIQNPAQNPDLDFVQQLADGTVRLSFDRSRLSTPLDYEYRQPLDASQFRSPINRLCFDRSRPSTPCRQPLDIYQFRSPIQPINQPSQQTSTRPKGSPYPMSRRDLGVQLQGVRANSQLSTPCYTAKQDSIVDEQDDREQSPPSPSVTDMEQPPDQEPLNIMVLTKEFDPDLEELGKDFTSEENKAKREAYKASYTKDQKKKVYDAWVLFMREISRNVPFFIYFERYYGQKKQFCVSTKTWTLSKPNPTRNEASNPTPRQPPSKHHE